MTSRFLVLYGTTDGQTRKIATTIADALRALGDDVEVSNAKQQDAVARPEDFDAVVVAASVHAGRYQQSVLRWVRAHRAALSGRPTAFISVCLAVLERNPKTDREVDRIMSRFFNSTGWRPTTSKVVAGALQFTHYNWLKRLLMKRIVKKMVPDLDTRRDYDYTDWDDLKAFALAFHDQALGSRLRPAV